MTPNISSNLDNDPASKLHVSKRRVSRTRLNFIKEAGYGMQELIWVERESIPYYLRIEPHDFPVEFGGKRGFKITFFSVCCRGTMFFGNISSMMQWLGYMFGIVSVP